MKQVTKEVVREENETNLTKEGRVKTVESGAIYFVSVDGKDFQIESAMVTAKDLIAIAGHDPDKHHLMQVFKDGTEKKLLCDEVIKLCEYGIEKFKIDKTFVEIFVNQKKFDVRRGDITVKELKLLAGVPLAHNLAEVSCDTLNTLPDDGVLCITGGEKFVSFPRDGQAS